MFVTYNLKPSLQLIISILKKSVLKHAYNNSYPTF